MPGSRSRAGEFVQTRDSQTSRYVTAEYALPQVASVAIEMIISQGSIEGAENLGGTMPVMNRMPVPEIAQRLGIGRIAVYTTAANSQC
jgi:hypothetical protein